MLLYSVVWRWENDIILDIIKKFFFNIKTRLIPSFQKTIQSQ